MFYSYWGLGNRIHCNRFIDVTSKSLKPWTFWYKTNVINAITVISAIICTSRLSRRNIVITPLNMLNLITFLSKHFMWFTNNTNPHNDQINHFSFRQFSFRNNINHTKALFQFSSIIFFLILVYFEQFKNRNVSNRKKKTLVHHIILTINTNETKCVCVQ